MPAFVDTMYDQEAIVPGNLTDSIQARYEDGLKIDGREHGCVEVRDHVFDFRNIDPADQDEVLSGVCGANVVMRRCLIMGGIKAILAGNGDHPIRDFRQAHWKLQDCVIMDSGRRCPEAQDGVTVTMERCWIHGWGRPFDVRSFGAWAHRAGVIIAEDCLFTQPGFFVAGIANTVRDSLYHVGQAVNERGLRALFGWRNWMPGVTRGLTAATGGITLATRCWRNHSWIRVDGCEDWLEKPEDVKKLGWGIIEGLPEHARAHAVDLEMVLAAI